MSRSKVGYHFLGDGGGVQDVPRALNHLAKIQPNWSLVTNNPGLARQIKDRVPNTNVIMRHQIGANNGYWRDRGANAFLDHCLSVDPERRFWHVGVNELNDMAYEASVVNAMIARIRTGNPCPRIGLCNFSVGTPNDIPNEWATANGLTVVKGASDYSMYMVIITHDGYYMGYPTLGWQGNRWATTDMSQWPVRGGAAFDNEGKPINWLLGRHKNAIAALLKAYPNAHIPRFIFGEAGFESVAATEKNLGRKLEGGIEGHANYVQQTFGASPEDVMYRHDYWQIEAGLADSPEVEGVLKFCYGWNNDPMWAGFNVENKTHYHGLVEAWQCPAQLPQLKGIIVQPQPTPTTDYTPHRVEFVGTGYTSVNIRAGATTSAAKLATAATRGLAVFSDGKAVNGWLRLRLPATGEFGYVSAAYVRLEKLPLTMKG